MDPFTLTYFGIILPVALIAATYVIYRFRKKYRNQLRNYKADELATRTKHQYRAPRAEHQAFDIDDVSPQRADGDQ